MRKDLDMYASLSLVKNFPGVKSRLSDVDIAIIRENTEGEYSGLEHQVNNNNKKTAEEHMFNSG
jgi:isocitrate dehydrogenase (NAD+)